MDADFNGVILGVALQRKFVRATASVATAILMIASVSACSNETRDARNELAFLRANKGTPRQRCAAATRLSLAASKANDPDQFKSAQIAEMAECTAVSTFPGYADVPGGVLGKPANPDAEIEEEMASLNETAAK